MRQRNKSRVLACAVLLFGLHVLVPIPTGRLLPTDALALTPAEAKPLAPGQEGGEITKANWQQHPKIRAIRAVVKSVKAGLRGRAFKVSKREFTYCEPSGDFQETLREMAVDSTGRVRWYRREESSADRGLTKEHYYDEDGHLRFVFIRGGAARLEHRIYFDESGKRVWEENQYRRATVETYPEVWPAEGLQMSDPAEAFAAASPCREVKTKRSL
jgi:hypothetical protein